MPVYELLVQLVMDACRDVITVAMLRSTVCKYVVELLTPTVEN
jgi:hypothetical protein